MRIVLDLQGCQSTGSRMRGIGRYSLSLAKAMAQQAKGHEIWIALSAQFPETIEALRVEFEELVPQNRIVVWSAPGPVADCKPENQSRRLAAECLRETFLASLKPDIVHISSLIEGHGDDTVTSIGAFDCAYPNAVTLYDLIPLIHEGIYLKDPSNREWYLSKIEHLKRARLWLSISESSRQEGVNLLGLPERRVVNISTAADTIFKPQKITPEQEAAVRARYGISRPFVMYTGGLDHRKNIDGLIAAYARLPQKLRCAHQLVIVCKTRPPERKHLEALASKAGLAQGELVLTGYVSDEEMVALYNMTRLFVFPSWHEGFGLPVLEAMSCGAAVIGSDATSLPEVIGREDALFDARSEEAIAAKMQQALCDPAFHADLCAHAAVQSQRFSWAESARRALEAFETFHAENRGNTCPPVPVTTPLKKPRLAFFSPLPPAQSGIADYSAELIPELACHYEIEAIVQDPDATDPWLKAHIPVRSLPWFEANANWYDRVLYHFGSSLFHSHMFEMLERHPGVVVLHDFFLSGLLAHLEIKQENPGIWTKALYNSHGYAALLDRSEAAHASDIIFKYPCCRRVLEQATGVIIHSEFSRHLATKFFGFEITQKMAHIPLLRGSPTEVDRAAARQRLGFQEDDFVVCSFGFLSKSKLNDRLLAAWLASPLAQDKCCRLVFVGENEANAYGVRLAKTIQEYASDGRISITGFADAELFRNYLAAADLAVQLRTLSRGETSAAILDCFGFGVPVIVNAHGAAEELPAEIVEKLPDGFTDQELAMAMVELRNDPARRVALSDKAKAHLSCHHDPAQMAKKYFEAIELFDQANPHRAQRELAKALAQIDVPMSYEENPFVALARSMAENQGQVHGAPRQLLVDITSLVRANSTPEIQSMVRSLLWELLKAPAAGFRVEPVYITQEGMVCYARKVMSQWIGCDGTHWDDEPIEVRADDLFLGLDLSRALESQHSSPFGGLCNRGVQVFFFVHDLPKPLSRNWIENVTREARGILCISRSIADDLLAQMSGTKPGTRRPLKVGCLHLDATVGSSLPSESTWKEAAKQIQTILVDNAWYQQKQGKPKGVQIPPLRKGVV